ncbi:MAG: hypothetical protein AB8H79_10745 [Myxococcota bacterium]
MRMILPIIAAAAVSAACRPLPEGDPVYPDVVPFEDTGDSGGLPGDTPYDGSTPRLSFGTFYEGEASDFLIVDDQAVNYFIYQGYSQSTNSDRVEGFVSDELTLTADSWWGGAIQMAEGTTTDLSAWTTLHLAMRSDDESMEDFLLGFGGTGGEVRVSPTDFGFVADGDWHVLNIPMSSFDTANLAEATIPLLIIAEGGVAGTSVQIDDLYLEGE